MSTYIAPIRDMQFVLNEVAGLEEICALPGNEECSVDLVESILDEASKFATGVLDPINKVGDQVGHVCKDGVVTTAPGFKEAYKQYVEGGWPALGCDPEYGGQGLPVLVNQGVDPVWLAMLITVNLQSSFLTPPFGWALFYLKGVAPPEVSIKDIYKGVLPFIVLQGIALTLVFMYPKIATWLPKAIGW